jgi:hypothetical protein
VGSRGRDRLRAAMGDCLPVRNHGRDVTRQ